MPDEDEEMPSAHELARDRQRELISSELLRRAWTQADLARAAGLPRYTISRLVRGETLASKEVARKVEHALELEPGTLARASKAAGRSTVPEGIQFRKLPNGKERVQISMTIDTGARLAIEAIMHYGKPLDFARLAAIITALRSPPGASPSGSG